MTKPEIMFLQKLLLSSLFLAICLNSHAQSLVRLDSVKIDRANIWGVLAEAEGERFAMTVARGNVIYFQYVNDDLEVISEQVPVFTEADELPKIVDHKTVFWKGYYFITFSSAGDRQLYLVKIDKEGNRVGDIVTVWDQDDRPANEPGKPTNDMILITSPETLYVGHFQPASQHYIHGYDEDLNRSSDPFLTSNDLEHNNVGGGLYVNEQIHLFTGDMFGGESNLILTEWDKNFEPQAQAPQVLIESESGHANWFATGVAHDENTGYWYVGFQHLNPGEKVDEEHVDLAVFDACFNLIYREHTTEREYFRPHLLIHDNKLYLAYDQRGNGVYLHQYELIESGFASDNCSSSDDSKDDEDDDQSEAAKVELTNSALAENNTPGSEIGQLYIEGVEDELTYQLVSGEGDSDNEHFEISGEKLLTKIEFNYEERQLYEVRISASDGERTIVSALIVEVENVIEHSLSMTAVLDFGEVEVGESSSREFILAHDGEDNGLSISAIEVPAGFSLDVSSGELNVGEEMIIQISFSPTEAISYNGNLLVQSSAGEYSVSLTAMGAIVQSIERKEVSKDLLIYPQPATKTVTLDASELGAPILAYEVIDLNGGVLLAQSVSPAAKLELDVSLLPNGLQLIRVITSQGIIKKTLVKH